LLNSSFFQSIPDYWGLAQSFPLMPLHYINSSKTLRPASLWDITCDSDGEIEFDIDLPLYLHDIDVTKEEYFLAFFLTGAYQEVLGMKHNLFTHPTEATITFNESGEYIISNIIESQNIMDVLDDIEYDISWIDKQLKRQLDESLVITQVQRDKLLNKLYFYLNENSYLKMIQANRH
jgi:arginine decarboxylase